MQNPFTYGDRYERWSPALALIGGAFIIVAALIWLVLGGSTGGAQYVPLIQGGLVLGLVLLIAALAVRPSLWLGWLGVRQLRYGLNALIMVAAFLAIVVLLNFVAKQPAFAKQWDLTEEQELTLTQATKDLINGLAEPVQVVGFYTQQQQSQQDSAESLLKRYQEVNKDKISYVFIDPQSPQGVTAAGVFGIRSASDLGLWVTQGERRQKVESESEEGLTTAIYKLTTVSRTVYFLQGHGELSPNQGLSNATQALEGLGFIVRTTQITSTLVPTDTSAIVIAGPVADFRDNEIQALNAYLAQGGAVMLLLDPDIVIEGIQSSQGAQPTPFGGPLDTYLRSTWGISASRDLVIDYVNSYQQLGPISTLVSAYPAHQITTKMSLPTLLAYNRSLSLSSPLPEGIAGAPFLATANATQPGAIYGETDMESLKDQQKGPTWDPNTDLAAPLNLGIAATIPVSGTNPPRYGRLVVVGSTSLIADNLPGNMQGPIAAGGAANRGIWLNAINWMMTDQEASNATPPPDVHKDSTSRSLNLNKTTTAVIAQVFWTSVAVIPGLVVLAGVIVWFQRRR